MVWTRTQTIDARVGARETMNRADWATAAVLQAARRIDPGVTEALITTLAQPGLLVQVLTSGPEGRMPMLTLQAGGGGANVGANRVRLRPEEGGATPPP